MDFYNREGRPVVYTDDSAVFYLWDGAPVAFINDTAIYTFAGNFIGWLFDDWVRDQSGDAMLFSDSASGVGPLKPLKRSKPLKGFKRFAPLKGLRERPPLRTSPTNNWSSKRFW